MGKATARESGFADRTEAGPDTDGISLTVENPETTGGENAPPRLGQRFWDRHGDSSEAEAEPVSLSKTKIQIADPLRLKWLFREIGRLLFGLRARALKPQTEAEAMALAQAWMFTEEEQAECSIAVVNSINALPITIPHLNEASAVGEAIGTIAAVMQRKMQAEAMYLQAARNPATTPEGLQRFPQPGVMTAEPSQSA